MTLYQSVYAWYDITPASSPSCYPIPGIWQLVWTSTASTEAVQDSQDNLGQLVLSLLSVTTQAACIEIQYEIICIIYYLVYCVYICTLYSIMRLVSLQYSPPGSRYIMYLITIHNCPGWDSCTDTWVPHKIVIKSHYIKIIF